MPARAAKDRVHVSFKSPEELTYEQVCRIVEFGKVEARLLDELEAATRAGDREGVWVVAVALLQNADASQAAAKAP